MDSLKAKVEALTAEVDVLNLELKSNSNMAEQSKKDVTSLEETLARKTKEIYELTVQLGSLKEENHQCKRDLEDIKVELEIRLTNQKERCDLQYK